MPNPPPKWSQPELVEAVHVAVPATGSPYINLPDDGRDYILDMPATPRLVSMVVQGGRNVLLAGGEIAVSAADPIHRALQIKNTHGTFHVEGLHVSKADQADAITIDAPKAVVQIVNTRVEGVRGWFDGWHADVLQPWGGVKSLRVDGLTGVTAYQGIQFSDLRGPIGDIELRRVNLIGSGRQVWAKEKNGGNGGFLLWFDADHTIPTILDEVYLNPRHERGARLATWPSAKAPGASVLSPDERAISFPSLPAVQGLASIGRPKGGDFVPVGSVGIGHVCEQTLRNAGVSI